MSAAYAPDDEDRKEVERYRRFYERMSNMGYSDEDIDRAWEEDFVMFDSFPDIPHNDWPPSYRLVTEPSEHPGDEREEEIMSRLKSGKTLSTNEIRALRTENVSNPNATEGLSRRFRPPFLDEYDYDSGEEPDWDDYFGTFRGIKWNDDTGFRTGEPMDLSWRLLKLEPRVPSTRNLLLEHRRNLSGRTGRPMSPKLYSDKQAPTEYQRRRLLEMDFTEPLTDMSAQDAQKVIHSLRKEGRISGLEQLQENRTPKGKFIGATGRDYVSGPHRAAIEGEKYDAPYPWGYWIPPEEPVNPNEDEPHDEAFNEWYGEGEEQYDPYLTDYWESSHWLRPTPVQTGEPMDLSWRLLKSRYYER